jgi:predicted ATPase
VRELLGALGPTVLVLEDLQWAGQPTLELLPFLVPQLPAELVLICTYRRQDLPEGSKVLGLAARLPNEIGYAHVTVEPLDRGHVRDLVGAILQTDQVSDEFAQYLSERSAGLPFAVEEVLLLPAAAACGSDAGSSSWRCLGRFETRSSSGLDNSVPMPTAPSAGGRPT